jgi:stage II sporulation protein AA (anti-sigma F factor antagonist)
MNDARLSVHAAGDRVDFTVSGDVDLANASDIEAELTAAIPNRATSVTLDLSDVTYLDSAGLQVVFALAVKLRRLQIEIRVIAPEDSPARHAIDMAGMASITDIEPSY